MDKRPLAATRLPATRIVTRAEVARGETTNADTSVTRTKLTLAIPASPIASRSARALLDDTEQQGAALRRDRTPIAARRQLAAGRILKLEAPLRLLCRHRAVSPPSTALRTTRCELPDFDGRATRTALVRGASQGET